MAADRVIGMRFGLDVPVDGPYADPRLLARHLELTRKGPPSS